MSQPVSIPHALALLAHERPDDTAFTFVGAGLAVERELTYGELAESAGRVAGFLRSRVKPGDRALLLVPPGADYLAAFLGCLSAGVVAVPLYPPRPGAKLDRISAVVRDCLAQVALTTSALAPLLADLPLTSYAIDDVTAEPIAPLPHLDAVAFLQYTSGSTGHPKGVMVSHRNLSANLSAVAAGFGIRDDDVIFSWLPMYHDMGLIGTTLLPLFTGRPAVLQNTFEFVRDPLSWPLAVDRFGATCSGGPNFAYRLLTERHDASRLSGVDLSRWRIAFNGAEPVSAATMDAFTERYAAHGFSHRAWFPCYGLAEATLFVSGATPMSGYGTADVDGRAVVSTGAVARDTTVVIRGDDGEARAEGEVGEICVRGPGVARGYWNKDSTGTFRTTVPGHSGHFLRTGDLGALVDGELHVAGRVKDLIIVGGRNYHPHDVEAAAAADPRVRFGAACQVDDRVVLVLEVTPESTVDDLPDVVRRAVSVACELELTEVMLVRPGAIPRTSSGKIRRGETRQRYLAGRLKIVVTNPAVLDDGTDVRALLTDRIGFAVRDEDFRRPLAALGLDSLKLVAIKGAVEQTLGVSLPAELFFGDATLDDVIAAARTATPPAALAPVATRAATDSQLQLQFFDQLHPDDRTNTLTCALRFGRSFPETRLYAAVDAAVTRHAALRTTIRDGVQEVHDEPRFEWDSLELADDTGDHDFLSVVAYRPFDLADGPLLRAAAVRTPGATTLLLACHHAIADYASLRIVLADVIAELVERPDFALGAGPTTALEWAAEQERETPEKAAKLAALADRWRPHRDRVLFPAPVTSRRRNPAATVDFALDAGAVYEHSRERGFTPFVTLAAAYLRALHRVTGAPQVVVATPHHGRTDTRFAGAVGYLVNPVPLLGDFTAGDDLPSLEDRTWRGLREALSSADVPFPRLVRALAPERHGQNPLYQAMITFQQSADGRLGDGFAVPWSGAHATVAGVAVDVVDVPPRDAAFAVSLYGARDGDRLVFRLVYQRELVDEPTARRVAEEFRAALAEAVGPAGQIRGDLPAPSLAWVPNLAEGFARAVALFGDRIAVRDRGVALSYQDVEHRVAELAGILRGVDSTAPVGILLERSAEMVIAALAVNRIGAAYVPVDPATPSGRVALILEDAEPSLVITSSDLADRVPDGVPLLLVDEPLPAVPPMTADGCPSTWDSRAYVIFTSGTTGRPKGVQVSNGNMLRLFTATESRYGFGPADVWSLCHSFAFDVSVWEMWGALLHGGSLVVVPDATVRDPAALRELLRAERVTVLSQTPTAFTQLAAEDVQHADRLPLRWVVLGGEALHFCDLRRWIDKYGDEDPRLANMYGITETTVHASFRRVRRADLDQAASLIGRPLSDVDFTIVDEAMNPVAAGEIGEIVVTGPCVAMGYLNQPDLTAERFVTVAGVRGYRSGDLAARLPSGEFAYHGRLDDQVKIRGFRIELSEIRAALGAVPGVTRAAVVVERPHATVRGDRVAPARITETRDLIRGGPAAPARSPRIVAYVVGDDTLRPTVLFDQLRARLPEYMTPAFVVAVDEIPVNHNGKVATDRLPAPTAANCLRERPAAAAGTRNGTDVQLMCALFEEVLGTAGIGPDDSFFSVGGDSIIALRLRAASLARGVSIELGDLYTLQTPRALAAHLDLTAGIPATEAPVPVGQFALLTSADIDALPDDVVDAYPIGTQQAGSLFDNACQTDIFSFRLRAPFRQDAMTSAVAGVVARHEILRTSFDFTRFSQPMQLVHESGSPRVAVTDLRSLAPSEQDSALARWRARELATPYDWARPPLVRFAVHLLSDTEFQLAVGCHDALLDGWSESALVTEILTDYWTLLGGGSPNEQEPPALRFADYIAAEQDILANTRAREQWAAELSDVEPTLLPRLASGADDDDRTGFLAVDVPADLSARLDELAAANRVSLKHVLLAVHARVLALLTGRGEVVLGVESSGRVDGPGGADVLGAHVNTVPYRLYTSDLPWTKLIDSALAKETTLLGVRAFPYADVRGIAGVTELTDVSFTYTHFHGYGRLASATGITVVDAKAYLRTNVTLRAEFNTDPFSKLLTLDLQANLARVTEAQLRQIAAAYRNALEHVVSAPEAVPANRDLLGETWWRALLDEARGPVREHEDSGFFDLFARSSARYPHLAAAVCGTDALTYADLADRVDRLAGWLNAYGVDRDTVVGLRAGRGLDHLVAVLAIMRAGAVYLPLPAGPPVRVASMVRRGEAVLVLHDKAGRDLVWEAVEGTTTATVDLADALAAARGHAPYRARLPRGDDNAYLIFTSGSTGEPKGALLRHDGMLNHVQAKIDVLGLTNVDRVAQDAAATFDISLWQSFAPLAVGGTTVIYPDEVAQDPPALLRAVARDAVTVLEVSPPVLSVFCAELHHYGISAYAPFRLRWVASSGETLKPRTANEFRRLLPAVRLMNMWGITETSDDCTHYELTGEADERLASVPVGTPIANATVYVLDEHRQPVPVGTPGELYVGGVCVGEGYVNDPDRTTAAFVPDPFTPGAVLYRTGDRGRRLADGGIEFLGRLDGQLKIGGQRVELGEVARALANVDAVRDSAVVVRTDNDGTRLAAFFVAAADLSTTVLRKALGAVLPRHAVPDFLVRVAELPRTLHGKVDTAALLALDMPVADADDEASATEAAILDVLGSVLGERVTDPTTDFFALGGHSLHATQVMARLRDRFGIELPVRLLFEHPNARALAKCVGTGSALVPQRIPARPADATRFGLTRGQAELWFAQQVDPGDHAQESTSLLRIAGPLDVEALRAAVATLARRHEALTLRFGSADGVPYQEPNPGAGPELEVVATDAVPDDLPAYLRAHGGGLDLANGPLARARLWRLGSDDHVLEWTVHDIVSDGWSGHIVLREIREAYSAHVAGRAPELPELTAQYADYASWQEDFLTTGAQTGFWRSYLDGYEGELALSTDFPRTPDRARTAGSATRTWSRSDVRRLTSFAAARQATPFMLCHAAAAVLMAKVAQQTDVVLGAMVAGRTVPGTENLVGCFAGPVPLRYTVDLADTPNDLVAAVTRSALQAVENQLLPFPSIVAASGVARTQGVPPLVQVLVTYDDFPLDLSGMPGLASTLTHLPPVTSQYDLSFGFVAEDGLTLTLRYDATLFTPATAERLLDAMAAVLDFFVTRPDEPLTSAVLARPADRQALAALWLSLTGTEFDPDTVLESPSCPEFLDLVAKRGLLTALLLAL